jgi:hypothetical protein
MLRALEPAILQFGTVRRDISALPEAQAFIILVRADPSGGGAERVHAAN